MTILFIFSVHWDWWTVISSNLYYNYFNFRHLYKPLLECKLSCPTYFTYICIAIFVVFRSKSLKFHAILITWLPMIAYSITLAVQAPFGPSITQQEPSLPIHYIGFVFDKNWTRVVHYIRPIKSAALLTLSNSVVRLLLRYIYDLLSDPPNLHPETSLLRAKLGV